MTQLVRNLKTEVVHQPQCRKRGANCEPWHYATMRSIDEISRDTETYSWLHLCGTCLTGYCRCKTCKAEWSAVTR